MNIKTLLNQIGLRPDSGLRSLGRGILLAALVGAAAGLGAIVFHSLCLVVSRVGLQWLARYEPGGPANEAQLLPPFLAPTDLRVWMLPIVPAIGGLISGLLVYRLASETEGHGTDAAIRAYHRNRGLIRARVPLVKLVASALTLGTGGSGGREGPIALIGAGFGSLLASRLRLSDTERRTLMAAGLGAGIGAIFHAPLAGAIFAIEVLYRDPDFEADALIPAFIATTVSYSVFCVAFGLSSFSPLFVVATADLAFTRPLLLLLPLAALALAMSVASLLYVKAFYTTQSLFQRMPLPSWLKPALGALASGVVAAVLYLAFKRLGPDAQHDSLSVLSFGYGFLQKVLNPDQFGKPLVAVLLLVGLGKILTTSLTIGSGGSGGVFGPSMVIGGSLGAVVGVVFHHWMPGLVGASDVVTFAILGMASFFAATAKTPVSTLIMVSELTDSYMLLLPSMWVCALAYLTSRGWTIYREQVISRLESPAHRGDFIVDMLEGLTVSQALSEAHRKFIAVPLAMPLSELSRLITSTLQSSFPVLDDAGRYYGLFSLDDIRQYLYDTQLGPLAVAQDLATASVKPLTLQMDLSDAIGRFAQGRFDELPVVDERASERVVAMLRRQDVIMLYDKQLLESRAG